MKPAADNSTPPPWLTCWAWLTVGAVLPLLFLGALVTTLRVGMADQRSVVSPLEALGEMFGSERSLGWKIEHAHRLAGWFAGICGIGLAIGFWFGEKRSWFRWLGLVGLTLISAQGLLGIFRVQLNALWGTDLAWIHGIFAQIVFAGLACIASIASAGPHSQDRSPAPALQKWSLVCVGLVLGQLVLGGMIRHQPNLVAARIHILGAFLVLAGLLRLARLAYDGSFRWMAWLILGSVALEVALGVETGVHWMARYFRPEFAASETVAQLLTRSIHYVVGSLVFAVTAVTALNAQKSAFLLAETARRKDVLPAVEASVPLQTLQGGLA